MNQKEKARLKELIKETCIHLLEERIETASNAMDFAQESANSSEKSSAGDKYETSRAMGHLDRDLNSRQLDAARKELAWFQAIDFSKSYKKVETGAIVICRNSIFFIAVGLGEKKIDEKVVVLLSPKSPLAAAMINLVPGNSFSFNDNLYEISEIF